MLKTAKEVAKLTSIARKAMDTQKGLLSKIELWLNNEVASKIEENARQGRYGFRMFTENCPDVDIACIELKSKGYKVNKHRDHILIVWGKLG